MKKKEGFLKFIITYKLCMGTLEVVLSIAVLSLLNRDMGALSTQFAGLLNLDIDNRFISTAIDRLGLVHNGTIVAISIGTFTIGALNVVEGWGLHLRRRWAEWLTVAATGVFIPFEIYTVIDEVTVLRVSVLLLNCTIVYYLAKHKELFKSKKGD